MASTRDRSRRTQQLAAEFKADCAARDAPCAICGQGGIDYDGPPYQPDSYERDHRTSIKRAPELENDPSNWQPSHHRCNRSKGAGSALHGVGALDEDF